MNIRVKNPSQKLKVDVLKASRLKTSELTVTGVKTLIKS